MIFCFQMIFMKISLQQWDSCIIEGFVLNELYKKKKQRII